MFSVVEHIDELNGELWSPKQPRHTCSSNKRRPPTQSADKQNRSEQQFKHRRSLSEADSLLSVMPRTDRRLSETVCSTEPCDNTMNEYVN